MDSNNVPAEFLAAFGATAPAAPEQPPAQENPAPPSEEQALPAPTPETPPAPAPESPAPEAPPAPVPTPATKADNAFAQLRIQNSNYEKLIKGVAEMLGVQEIKDPAAIQAAIQEKILAAQASKQNIPVEVLSRLSKLEEENQSYVKQQLEASAYRGFQSVKDAHKLTDQQLNDFADALIRDGINPFERQVNLMMEYRNRNWDTLMAQAKAEGAREEAARAAHANQFSTQPNSQQGPQQSTGDGEKVNTIAGLESFFRDNSK